MKKISVILSVLFLFSSAAFAQKTFLLKNASKNFDVRIEISSCEEDTCEGEGTVFLSRKGQKKVFQKIEMANVFLELGTDQKPTANLIELYGENNSGIIFDDYNFDGVQDLAIRNGNNGAYGGPSYDVYLFTRTKNRFVENEMLTEIASNNLGMFTVDKKNRTIETFTKSGCCWHQTTRYKIVKNQPKKVYVLTEDAMTGGGEKEITTTEILMPNGKWKKTVKTRKIS